MGPHVMRRPPKFVHGFIDRHGKPRWYFRRVGFKQVPLPGLPWSPEFMAAYEAALNAPRSPIGAKRAGPNSVNEAVARYLQSKAFIEGLAPITQVLRRQLLERFRTAHGEKRLAMMEARHVAQLLGSLRPYPQRNMLKALRGLMAFAMAERLIEVDPTSSYKPTRIKDTGGFIPWTDIDIAKFEATHPIGSRARLALALLLFTGQRRGDVVRIGRQHIRDGILSLKQNKTGAQIDIPVLAELRLVLDATPSDHLTFLVNESGQPFTAEGFGKWFRQVCNQAGLEKGLSAHGLRKAAATRLADHGATAHELMAWFGWASLTEAERYTRAANRKALAQGVVKKLATRTDGGKP
jgi:integrase